MSNRSNVSGGGIGFGGALFLLFLGLKLTGHVDWSWWWVTAPLWVPFVVVVGLFMLFTALALAFRNKINYRITRR